jgi:hypothetical protein
MDLWMYALFPTSKHEDLDVVIMTTTKILISNYDKLFFMYQERGKWHIFYIKAAAYKGHIFRFPYVPFIYKFDCIFANTKSYLNAFERGIPYLC